MPPGDLAGPIAEDVVPAEADGSRRRFTARWGSPHAHWRRFRLLVLLLFLARGVVLLCILPPFEGWDEYQHVAYIVHLIEHGADPVFGSSRVSAELLRRLGAFPHPALAIEQLGGLGLRGYDAFWTAGPAAPPGRLKGTVRLYQAQHGSLYYRLAAPIFAAGGGLDDLKTSISLLRLINLVLAAGAVWIALGAFDRVFADRRVAGLLGLLVAAHPLFLLNAVRVANDALAVLLGTIVIVWCLTFDVAPAPFAARPGVAAATLRPATFRQGAALGRAAAIGLVLGLAVLAKVINLALLPFAIACLMGSSLRGGRKPPSLRARGKPLACGVLLLGVTAVTFAYFRSNLFHFGLLTPMQEAVANRAAGRGVSDLAAAAGEIGWLTEWRRLWLRHSLWAGGWSFASLPPAFRNVYQGLLIASLLGWLPLLWRRWERGRRREEGAARRPTPADIRRPTPADPRACLWSLILCACMTAAVSYHMIQSKAALGRPVMNAWYLAVAMPWLLLLAVGGAMSWPGGRWRWALPMSLLMLFAAADMVGMAGRLIPLYSAGPAGRLALQRLASLHPAWLGTPTLWAAAVVAGGCLCLSCWALRGRRDFVSRSGRYGL